MSVWPQNSLRPKIQGFDQSSGNDFIKLRLWFTLAEKREVVWSWKVWNCVTGWSYLCRIAIQSGIIGKPVYSPFHKRPILLLFFSTAGVGAGQMRMPKQMKIGQQSNFFLPLYKLWNSYARYIFIHILYFSCQLLFQLLGRKVETELVSCLILFARSLSLWTAWAQTSPHRRVWRECPC